MIPASNPPDTDVIPARYAVANTLKPKMASNGSKVTLVCLYANNEPPNPATNAAIPNAATLVATTLIPAAATANLTTATGKPRPRNAGNPTLTPITIAPNAANSGATGNGTPQLAVNGLNKNAAAPARVNWAKDT